MSDYLCVCMLATTTFQLVFELLLMAYLIMIRLHSIECFSEIFRNFNMQSLVLQQSDASTNAYIRDYMGSSPTASNLLIGDEPI